MCRQSQTRRVPSPEYCAQPICPSNCDFSVEGADATSIKVNDDWGSHSLTELPRRDHRVEDDRVLPELTSGIMLRKNAGGDP